MRMNPFPGLRSFQSEEDYLFFGRDRQTAELLKRLRTHRLLAIVGTSGSGKSSLVRAGMIPALISGSMHRAGSMWEVAIMRPGGNPVAHLAQALCDSGIYDDEDEEVRFHLKATLRRSWNGLVESVRQSRLEPGANLLLVVDQFEEIFRFNQGNTENQDEANDFIQLLLQACQQEKQPIYVALTMRSDFLGDCSRFLGLAEAVNNGEYLIPGMTRDQLAETIEGPIKVAGCEIAPRLLQTLINDVGENQDQLPVLQHALMRTCEHWARRVAGQRPSEIRESVIDLIDYQGIGGMKEALSRHADEVFEQLPDDRHRLVAEKVFKALTEQGDDNREIRRPTRMGHLSKIVNAPLEEVSRVVQAYRAPGVTFLMPPDTVDLTPDTIIDLSHESLMRVWSRLRHWVAEESQSVRIFTRLAETAELWSENKAGLYRDPDLQVALTWRDQHNPTTTWADRLNVDLNQVDTFLEQSRTAARAEVDALEKQRLRELRNARRFSGMVGISLVVLLILFAWAWKQKGRAERATKQAEQAAEQAEQATEQAKEAEQKTVDLLEDSRFEQGKAWLERANFLIEQKDFFGARMMAGRAIGYQGFGREQQTPGFLEDYPVFFKPDQEEYRQVTHILQSKPKYSLIWGSPTAAHTQWFIYSVAFHPDGSLIATGGGGEDNSIRLWDVASGQLKRKFEGDSGVVLSVAFSPDGTLLAAGSSDSSVRLWQTESGKLRTTLKGHSGAVGSVAFSPDGSLLASGGEFNSVRLWEVASGQFQTEFKGDHGDVYSVAFSPDGSLLAFGDSDGSVRLWNIASHQLQAELPGHTGSVLSVAFSPDGSLLASGSEDKSIRLREVASGRLKAELTGHTSYVSSVDFNPDGSLLASGSWDNSVRLWDIRSEKIKAILPGHSNVVRSVAFSPDGTLTGFGRPRPHN